MKQLFIFCFSILIISSCKNEKTADAVYFNGKVYTVDSTFKIVNAFAVKNGKIIATGTNEEIEKYSTANKVDLKGKFVYPGFIDPHCHFYHSYGLNLQKIWLYNTVSFQSVLDTLLSKKDQLFMGWIFARGWDQNDWNDKTLPDNTELNKLFPDIPVLLVRIDGHAALVNQKALDIAGITDTTKVNGGEIIKKNGKPTGLLIDYAIDLVELKIPQPPAEIRKQLALQAQKNCFEAGLTSVAEAGLESDEIAFLDSIQKTGDLKMRMYAMAIFNSVNVEYLRRNGKIKTERMNVRSFKLYGDGALGSRGACLKQPYTDMKDHFGMLLHSIDSIKIAAKIASEMKFQLNTHCIGDSANHIVLQIYADELKGKNNFRWRIEHAQIVDPEDLHYFKDYSVIPSVQPTHATSDMYWAGDRLGEERLKYGYTYQQLLQQNGMLANGSDFPVESINPLFGFYAAVSRKDQKGIPVNGFQKENALSREQALRAMTIWAAYADFEENEKGSIEPGKFADFVITDKDLMTDEESNLFKIKVLQTIVGGEKVFTAE